MYGENSSGWLAAIEQAAWDASVKEYKVRFRSFSIPILQGMIYLRKMRKSRWQRFCVAVGITLEEPKVQAAKEIIRGWKLINS